MVTEDWHRQLNMDRLPYEKSRGKVLDVHNLCKVYGSQPQPAVNRVNFYVEEGEVSYSAKCEPCFTKSNNLGEYGCTTGGTITMPTGS